MTARKRTALLLALFLVFSFVTSFPAQAADGLVVTSVSPNTVQAGQSIRLTLYGSSLAEVSEVYAGGIALSEVTPSATQVTALVPADKLKTLGWVDVKVITPTGQSYTLPNALKVLSNPQIVETHRADQDPGSLQYRTVPSIGDVPIVVTGERFMPGLTLTIGGRAATSVEVSSDGTQITAVAPYGTPGRKEIRVVNPDGGQYTLPDSASGTLVYRLSEPEISELVPRYGSTAGGTRFTIKGKEFDAAGRIKVQVGSGFAQVESVSPDHTTIVAVTPPGVPGTAQVTVTNADGISAFSSPGFEYVITPTISSVTPNFGPTSGNTEIVIRGTNFPENLGVLIGNLPPKDVKRYSDTEIHAITPAGPLGPVPVEVYDTTNEKKSFVLPNGFTYKEGTSAPSIEEIDPNTGSTVGGDVIYIRGSDFLAGPPDNPTKVLIGGVPAPAVTVENTTTIRVVSPPGQAGWRSVEVINPDGGRCKRENAFLYKLPEKLVLITGVTPNHGPIDERRPVVVSGANFLEPGENPEDIAEVEVRVGGNLAGNVRILDARTIGATAPLGGALGPQNVSVKLVRHRFLDNGQTVTQIDYAEIAGGYTYDPPQRIPVVESVFNPETKTAEGPVSGGSHVIIKGRYFETRPGIWPEVYFGPRTPEHKAEVVELAVDNPDAEPPIFYIEVVTPPAASPGAVPVWVVNPPIQDGDQPAAGVLENGFTYRGNNLYLSSVTPDRGPLGGGTYIEIAGENFGWSKDPKLLEEKTHVFIGKEEATLKGIVVNERGLDIIRAVTPPSSKAGAQDVKVVNPFGDATLKAAFTYYDRLSQPVIKDVFPAFGSGLGGTPLTITGIGFASGASVSVNGRAATKVEVNVKLDKDGNPVVDEDSGQVLTEITCIIPPGEAGPARITVTNKDGGSTFVDGKFTYISVPKITSITPAAGTIYGGTWVTIKGSGFLQEGLVGPTVYFGAQKATAVVYISPTEIAAKTPDATKAGPVDVTLVNPDAGRDGSLDSGRVTLPGGFTYRVPATSPAILAVDPQQGTTAGGTLVTITGSDFRQGVVVYFGYKPASKVTWRDYGKLEAVTPPGEEGAVDVTVINPDYGQAQKEGGFTYVSPGSLPEIHSVFPPEGSLAGGTLVTIKGVDFRVRPAGNILEYPKVLFGNRLAEVKSLTDSRGELVKDDKGYGTTLKVLSPPADKEGTVDVTVINPDAAQVTLAGAFTYRRTSTQPQIEALSPDRGQASGGTPVVLTGSDFSQGAKVFFDGNPAQKVTWLSSTALFAITPAGPANRAVDVTVLNPDGASYTMEQRFQYVPDPLLQPRITAVIPNQGPVTGGTKVDIWGTNFREGITVLFGGQTVPVEVYGPGPAGPAYVRVTAPPVAAPGAVHVSVVNPDGGAATLPGGFTYTAPTAAITLSAIIPAKGPRAGNIPAEIHGSGFLQRAKVFFGSVEARDVKAVDSSAITLTVPPAPPGQGDLTVDVVVVNPDGASARLANAFTYTTPQSQPALQAIVPNTGRSQGGTPVTIAGSGFEKVPAVFFGGRAAQNVTWISESELTARTPPGAPGPVTVTVVNPDGAAASLPQAFTYEDKPGPAITKIDPTSGPSGGGTKVTITGSGFDPGIRVEFGGVEAAAVTRISDGELTAITPEHDLGTVAVTVTNPDGSTFTLPDAFTFTGPPKPPTGLRARALSANTIELTWTAPTGALTYEICMGTESDKLAFLGTSEGKAYGAPADRPEVRYFYAENLEPDTRYYFAVRAVNAEGVSGETLTASARTKDEDYTEPTDKPKVPAYKVARAGGAGGTVITLAPGVLGGTRFTIDLDKPEYGRERRFSIILPAGDLSERTTVYLTAPRLAFSFPVRAFYTGAVRSLSSREEERAAVTVTLEEAEGAETQAILRELPAGLIPASPVYRLSSKLSVGPREEEILSLAEKVTLKAKIDPAYYAGAPALYRYEPVRATWVNAAAYLSLWSGEVVLDRPGFYAVLARRR